MDMARRPYISRGGHAEGTCIVRYSMHIGNNDYGRFEQAGQIPTRGYSLRMSGRLKGYQVSCHWFGGTPY